MVAHFFMPKVGAAKSGNEPQPPVDPANVASHVMLALCVSVFVIFGLWSWIGTLDIVSVAVGEVKPSSRVKEVQHLEGGIISAIHVQEGQTVTQGQILLDLEATQSGADLNEITVHMFGLQAQIARLMAEEQGEDQIAFPETIEKDYAHLAASTNNVFHARRARLKADIRAQEDLVKQRGADIREISARINNARESIKYLDEQIAISADLMKDQLTNRYNHLELLRDRSSMQSRVDEDEAALRGAEAAKREAEVQMERITASYQEEVRTELEKTRQQFNEVVERRRKYQDSQERKAVRSPVEGIIKTLSISTIGGVVKAGDTVMEIVPVEDNLIIEAALPTQDIGYVNTGQQAEIKLNSPDLASFGIIEADVIHISPDTIVNDDGTPFYMVKMQTHRDYFERGDKRFQLYPGMQVVASIQTGERRVIDYLLDPLVGRMDEAMRER